MTAAVRSSGEVATEAHVVDGEADAALEWDEKFTYMWIDLLETHGQAVDTVSQLAAQLRASSTASGSGFSSSGYSSNGVVDGGVLSGVDGVEKQTNNAEDTVATLQASMQSVTNLLSSVEEIIRVRIMGIVTDDHDTTAADPTHQQQQTQNSLDAYLDGAAIEEDPAFVNSVRGWDTTKSPVQAKAFVPDAIVQSGLQLHDALLQNTHRCINGMHGARPAGHTYNAHHALGSRSAAVDAAGERAKKRKLASVTAPYMGQQDDSNEQYREARSTISRRHLRSTLANLIAESVIRHRDGAHLCSYLMKYVELDDPVWVLRKQCAPQAQQVIDEFNKVRMAARNKANHQRARRKHRSSASTSRGAADGESAGEGDIYVVDKIVGHRMRYGKKQYLVKWDGYDSCDNTWEAASKLQDDVADLVDAYERTVALAGVHDPYAVAPAKSSSGGRSGLSRGRPLVPSSSSDNHEKTKHRHVGDMKRRRKHRVVMVKSALTVADDDDDSDGIVEILSGHDDHYSDADSVIDVENEVVIVDSDDSAL